MRSRTSPHPAQPARSVLSPAAADAAPPVPKAPPGYGVALAARVITPAVRYRKPEPRTHIATSTVTNSTGHKIGRDVVERYRVSFY
jgi:hypothetical protein